MISIANKKRLAIIVAILTLIIGSENKVESQIKSFATKENQLRDPNVEIDTINISENEMYLKYYGSFKKPSNPQKPTVFPEYEKKIVKEGTLLNGKKHGDWKVYNYRHGPDLISDNLNLEIWEIEYNVGTVITKFFDYELKCENNMVAQVFPELEDELSLDYPNSTNGAPVNKIYSIPTDCGDLIYDFNNFSNLNDSKFEMLDQSNKLFSCEFWSVFLSANQEPKNDYLSCSNWQSELSKLDSELGSDLINLLANDDYAARYNKYAFCDVNNDDIMDLLFKDGYRNRIFTKMTLESPLIEIGN